MQKKTTSKLETELKKYNTLDHFLKENKQELSSESLSAQLQDLIAAKGMSRAEAVRESNLNEVYAYQIISGVRRPSRDKLLCLCFAMKTTLKETQSLLKRNGFAPLYARNQRDSIIIFAIEHAMTLLDLNEALYEHGKDTL